MSDQKQNKSVYKKIADDMKIEKIAIFKAKDRLKTLDASKKIAVEELMKI